MRKEPHSLKSAGLFSNSQTLNKSAASNTDSIYLLHRMYWLSQQSVLKLEDKSEIKYEIDLGDNEILIMCKKYNLLIIGEKLNIKYYNSESMVVSGVLNEISFI